MKEHKNYRDPNTENVNEKINEEFYEGGEPFRRKGGKATNSTEANQQLNDRLASGGEQPGRPASYMNNNTPAFDIRKDDDRR